VAEQYYRKSIDLDPRNGDYWGTLGYLLVKQGRLAEAKEVARRHVRLRTDAPEYGHWNLGIIYRSEQKYRIALRHAEKALAIDPYIHASGILRDDVLEAIITGSDEASSDNICFDERWNAVDELDIKEEAVAGYLDAAQRLANDFPEEPIAWLLLGRALTGVHRYEEALKALHKSIPLWLSGNACATAFATKATVYYQRGSPRLAERWCRKAIDEAPRNGDLWHNLGALLVEQGRLTEAKDVWRRQTKLVTGDAALGHFWLGSIYRAEQKYKIALRHAEKALAIDPNDEDAKLLRTDLLEVMNE
jgi:tetratricopeptide (TPR) repeat protein